MTESSKSSLPGPLLRRLKSRGQLLEPTVMIGKGGLSEEFRRQLEEELDRKELVKVRFVAFKEEKKQLSLRLAEEMKCHLVMRVGNVAVLYRQQSDPEKRRFQVQN